MRIFWLALAACVIAVPANPAAAASTSAQPYPSKAIRFVVPFAPGGAPGQVSPELGEGPVRGQGASAAGFIPVAASSAQPYPSKAIRFVVPFAPGGGTDIIARILAQQLNEALGQPVVVDNRAGAGSTVGTDIVTKAPADGYTVLLGNISLAFNAWLYKKLPYNAITDLAAVTMVAVQPNIVVIHPSVPAKSLKEFAAYAQAHPGKLSFASAGAGSGTHLAGEMLKERLGIDMVHVPYKGTGPALTDLIGGQVQVMISTFASALPHVKTGRLRALGVTSAKRSPATPEVPTLIEAGVPNYDYSTWYALFAPAATPRPVIDKLNRTTRSVLAADDIKQKFDAQGVEPWTGTAAELAAYLRAETDKWGKVVRAAGIPQL